MAATIADGPDIDPAAARGREGQDGPRLSSNQFAAARWIPEKTGPQWPAAEKC